jgi:hypothetical protein
MATWRELRTDFQILDLQVFRNEQFQSSAGSKVPFKPYIVFKIVRPINIPQYINAISGTFSKSQMLT